MFIRDLIDFSTITSTNTSFLIEKKCARVKQFHFGEGTRWALSFFYKFLSGKS